MLSCFVNLSIVLYDVVLQHEFYDKRRPLGEMFIVSLDLQFANDPEQLAKSFFWNRYSKHCEPHDEASSSLNLGFSELQFIRWL